MKVRIIQFFVLLISCSFFLQAQSKEIVKTFPANAGENLEISIDPGNIDIKTWNKNEVRIEVESRKSFEVEEIVAEKTGNTIKFFLELDDGWHNNIVVKVNAPSKFNFDLETTGGNINIEDPISGKLNAEIVPTTPNG